MKLMLPAGWGGGVGWRGNVHLRLLHEVDATRWMGWGGVGLHGDVHLDLLHEVDATRWMGGLGGVVGC